MIRNWVRMVPSPINRSSTWAFGGRNPASPRRHPAHGAHSRQNSFLSLYGWYRQSWRFQHAGFLRRPNMPGSNERGLVPLHGPVQKCHKCANQAVPTARAPEEWHQNRLEHTPRAARPARQAPLEHPTRANKSVAFSLTSLSMGKTGDRPYLQGARTSRDLAHGSNILALQEQFEFISCSAISNRTSSATRMERSPPMPTFAPLSPETSWHGEPLRTMTSASVFPKYLSADSSMTRPGIFFACCGMPLCQSPLRSGGGAGCPASPKPSFNPDEKRHENATPGWWARQRGQQPLAPPAHHWLRAQPRS